MTGQELWFRSLTEIAQQIRRQDVSPVEVTHAALERLERINPRLNACLTNLGEQALEAVKRDKQELVAGQPYGPLHGVPLVFKDIFAMQGVQVTGGSKVVGTWVPNYDATGVARLKAAGALVVGTLHLYEFAPAAGLNPHYGPAHNPWHLDHTTGGSSACSMAAVAAGIVYGTLGTDTGGSVRIPAGLCGLVGLKPTYGRVSRHGVLPRSWSLDHVGPLTRCVRDTALLMSILSGHDAHDHTSSRLPVRDYVAALIGHVPGLRVGVPRALFFEGLDTDVRERMQQGLLVPATAYLKAQRMRAVVRRDLEQTFHQVDVLVTPTAPIPAPKLDCSPGEIGAPLSTLRSTLRRLTQPFNLAGSPAVSVPCGFSRHGLPIGLQLVGRPFDDARVLNLAYAYEHGTPWKDRHPTL